MFDEIIEDENNSCGCDLDEDEIKREIEMKKALAKRKFSELN